MHLIKLQLELISTTNFEQANQEWTIKMHPKNKTLFDMFHFPKYIQVFEDKYDFISNLSIIDVLFNLGPQTIDYLNAIEFKNIPNG